MTTLTMMMTTDPTAPTVVKVNGQGGVLATVPALLGFHPQDSLCVVCLKGPRRQVGPIMRSDLEGFDIPRIVEVVKRHADELVLVVYAGPGVEYDLGPLARILAGIMPVIDVIEVGNTPTAIDPALEAANALVGRATLTGRDAVVASVAYRGWEASTAPPRLWTNPQERDKACVGYVREAKEVLPGLITMLTRTSDDDRQLADLAAVTAIVAYRNGDGALAQVCLDRALAVQPNHQLAQLMVVAVSSGMPPEDLEALMPKL